MNVRIGALIYVSGMVPKANGDPPTPVEMPSINGAKRYIHTSGGNFRNTRSFRRFKDVATGPDNIKRRIIELIAQ